MFYNHLPKSELGTVAKVANKVQYAAVPIDVGYGIISDKNSGKSLEDTLINAQTNFQVGAEGTILTYIAAITGGGPAAFVTGLIYQGGTEMIEDKNGMSYKERRTEETKMQYREGFIPNPLGTWGY